MPVLFDDRAGLLGGAWRVLPEVLLQGGLMLGQGALGVMPPAASEPGQSPVVVLVQGALDGPSGDTGKGSDLVVG